MLVSHAWPLKNYASIPRRLERQLCNGASSIANPHVDTSADVAGNTDCDLNSKTICKGIRSQEQCEEMNLDFPIRSRPFLQL